MNPEVVAGGAEPGCVSRRLQTTILRPVSRSFYLSIRVLPEPLRKPISVAYLLARTTDTIADSTGVSTDVRTETLQMLSNGIQGKASLDVVINLIASFVPLQTNKSEQELLQSLPDLLNWLEQMEQADRDEIRGVLSKITRGQMLDLERFRNPHETCALAASGDLDEYTYLVAGCVGEFWTRICFRHVREFAGRSEDEMLALGKRYGMALQLINVLRDAGSDLRAGRCYFPENELSAAQLNASEILVKPDRFQPIYESWLEKAKAGLGCGIEYARAIQNRRVRAATVLPALIGVRTLALLQLAGLTALHKTVKVPRAEVRRMIFALAVSLASRNRITALYERAKM